MNSAWIFATLLAASLQCVRTVLQKRMSTAITPGIANFARYIFGFPFAVAALVAFLGSDWAGAPELSWTFLAYCAAAALAQAIGTGALLSAFSHRSFAVAVGFSKTEAMQAALWSAALLGETVNFLGWMGITIGLAGIMLMTAASRRARDNTLLHPTRRDLRGAALGLLAGLLFGGSAVAIRAASMHLGDASAPFRAVMILAVMTAMQSFGFSAYLLYRDRRGLRLLLQNRRTGLLIGITSATASACWFVAMTLEAVSYVQALGQVELIFAVLSSHFLFREKLLGIEATGMLLIALGIVVLLLTR